MKVAVLKAMKSSQSVDENGGKNRSYYCKGLFRNDKERIPHVDDIHDMVENKLMDNGLNEVAKEYIVYRAKPDQIYFRKELT